MEALTTAAKKSGLYHEDPLAVFVTDYIEQGEIKGEAKGKNNVAKAMKAKGYPIQEIAELTGLSMEEIEAL